ncbi:MAG: glycosyl hydrolase family 18 protein [Cytophagales bacterium]
MRHIVSAFAILVFFNNLIAQKRIGYLASWSDGFEQVSFEHLTHVNFSFITPYGNGSLREDRFEGDKLFDVVKKAKKTNTKVLLAIGGWELGDGGGNDEAFETLASNEKSINAFVRAAMRMVDDYKLDGIDIDWEYPDEGKSAENFAKLMKALSLKLKEKNKLLTMAVVGHGEHTKGVLPEVFEYVDWVNIMSYDNAPGAHSTFEYAVQCLNEWQAKGLSKEKTVLGLPFYGKYPETAYKDLVFKNKENAQKDEEKGIHYNGISTIKAKTRLAMERASGIMIWEITQDAKGELSLMKAIREEMEKK